MTNKSYNLSICDISIQYALNGIDSSIEERLLPFLKDNKDYDIKIKVDKIKDIEFPKKSIPISVSNFNYVLDNEKNYIWADYCKSALVSSDADWCKVTISATRNMHTHIEESYLLNLLQGNLSKNKGFILHGSVIKYGNEPNAKMENIHTHFRAGETEINDQNLEDIQRRGKKVVDAIYKLVDIAVNGAKVIKTYSILSHIT